MASTNKTTNYLLSQYVGNDKPTYLTDYNQDMEKIDVGIHNAQIKADVNGNNIGDLNNLETTVKSSLVGAVNEVNTKATNNNTNIGVMTNLQTVDKTSLVGAVNEVNTIATGNSTNIGTMANLQTVEKTSLVGAINEVNTNTTNNTTTIGQHTSDLAQIHYDLNHLKDYSSNEAVIGTWIDGKPLYRTIFNYGTLPNATGLGKAHNIPIDTPVQAYGVVKSNTGTQYEWTIPSQNIFVDLSSDEVYITTMSDRTNLDAIVVLEYTKTTDTPAQ